MNNLLTVIRFTFNNKIRAKSFLITSIIIALIISIGVHVPFFIQLFSSDEVAKVGMFESESTIPAALEDFAQSQEKRPFEIVLFPNPGTESGQEEAIRKHISDGDVKTFLQLVEVEGEVFPKAILRASNAMQFDMASRLQPILYNLKNEMLLSDLNLSEDLKGKLFSPVEIESKQIQLSGNGSDAKTEEEVGVAYGMVYIIMILQFMAIMITGQLIATEITAEKSSRVMEILVTSVAPLKQMFGKIIGMLLLGISQIVLFVVVAVINLSLPHNKDALAGFNIDLSSIDPVLFIYFIVFYLMGYFLYATLFAGVGSIVSRTEDLGQAVMPITILSLAAFYIGIFGMATPNSTFIVISSFIPFFSPLIMFLRIGLSEPPFWEIALSLAILAASIFFFGWLSAKIYRTGVLMYGKRPSFKELRKAMKAFKV